MEITFDPALTIQVPYSVPALGNSEARLFRPWMQRSRHCVSGTACRTDIPPVFESGIVNLRPIAGNE